MNRGCLDYRSDVRSGEAFYLCCNELELSTIQTDKSELVAR